MQKDNAGRYRLLPLDVNVLECRATAMTVSMLLTLGAAQPAYAAELPTPCVAGACGPAVTGFVTSGQANAILSGNSLLIDQLTQAATLNWKSFNISKDGTVEFRQPNAESVALNKIWQADPSRILGALRANGQVYLINQNGILFGEGAQVNVSGLVASALDITPEAVERGIAQAATTGAPAFKAFTETGGGAVRVERGATLEAK
ncbi:MAG TPA: filamentous hemagglutinin N-terminal domain-containing protein, partial [Nitrospiraceae bacterium]|nr:filamentous hemagglutinin N-terminal domain-containing protein [Nitrospiraceae bacterium]